MRQERVTREFSLNTRFVFFLFAQDTENPAAFFTYATIKQAHITHPTSRSTRLECIVRSIPRLVNRAWIIHVQISISLRVKLINMCVHGCVIQRWQRRRIALHVATLCLSFTYGTGHGLRVPRCSMYGVSLLEINARLCQVILSEEHVRVCACSRNN